MCEALGLEDAEVVDEDLDLGHDGRDMGAALARAQVGGDAGDVGIAGLFSHLIDGVVYALRQSAVDNHCRPLAGQALCDCESDAGGRSADERDFSGDLQIHFFSRSAICQVWSFCSTSSSARRMSLAVRMGGLPGSAGRRTSWVRTESAFGLGAVGVVFDEAGQIGIGVGGVELHGEVEEVDGLIDFSSAAAQHFGGDVAAVGHFIEHALDLAGAHEFFEERGEQGILLQIFADADGGAKVDEADAVFGDDEIVEAEVEVNDFGRVVDGAQEVGALHGELELRERAAAAIAQPVHSQLPDESALVFFDLDNLRDSAGIGGGEIFLEDFEDGRLAGEEGGEDLVGELSARFSRVSRGRSGQRLRRRFTTASRLGTCFETTYSPCGPCRTNST